MQLDTIKKVLTPEDLEHAVKAPDYTYMPNRAKRRERTIKRFWQTRVRRDKKPDRWEWSPTKKHPRRCRIENRKRGKIAKASRKANR